MDFVVSRRRNLGKGFILYDRNFGINAGKAAL
jgi:hypothetical protein